MTLRADTRTPSATATASRKRPTHRRRRLRARAARRRYPRPPPVGRRPDRAARRAGVRGRAGGLDLIAVGGPSPRAATASSPSRRGHADARSPRTFSSKLEPLLARLDVVVAQRRDEPLDRTRPLSSSGSRTSSADVGGGTRGRRSRRRGRRRRDAPPPGRLGAPRPACRTRRRCGVSGVVEREQLARQAVRTRAGQCGPVPRSSSGRAGMPARLSTPVTVAPRSLDEPRPGSDRSADEHDPLVAEVDQVLRRRVPPATSSIVRHAGADRTRRARRPTPRRRNASTSSSRGVERTCSSRRCGRAARPARGTRRAARARDVADDDAVLGPVQRGGHAAHALDGDGYVKNGDHGASVPGGAPDRRRALARGRTRDVRRGEDARRPCG